MQNNELNREEKDKLLLDTEKVLGFTSAVAFVGSIIGVNCLEATDLVKLVIIVSSSVLFATEIGFCLKIEKEAGYYKCSKCDHTYVPEKYLDILVAPHVGYTRYMNCPECGKKSWQKKVIKK